MNKKEIDIIDLNIGEGYLRDWEIYYAIREIIANALDEQKDGNILIKNNNEDEYIIRDYGRGLKTDNFIIMGSDKADENDMIGKFGVGLKDALGVLTDRGIEVEIKTAKYLFKVRMKNKSKTTKSKTLHAYVYENDEEDFKGTEFKLKGCKKEYIDKAKEEFLNFKSNEVNFIEHTKYGDILEKQSDVSDIYINGMKISEDKDLLFSYNIKNVSSKLKKGLNRERKYVSRSNYSQDIKKIIQECRNKRILKDFEKQLGKTQDDSSYSEIKWNEVLVKTCNYIIGKYEHDNIRFISNKDILNNKELYDVLCQGKNVHIIEVSENIKMKINNCRKKINANSLFIEDPIILEEQLLDKNDLNEYQRCILEEAIDILSEVGLLKSEYLPIDNIKISAYPIGNIIHHEDGIIIPFNALSNLEVCAVKIINLVSSLGNNSTEFKNKVVGDLINIIHKRNIGIKIMKS